MVYIFGQVDQTDERGCRTCVNIVVVWRLA
ncbi:hypothetical protein CIPAW_03G211500 [Carya illinoinensis]|uniref:Uncharacterized protein n=1 Tax=Carya illinoinensis TaxID=32201 RepID=A0A8T1R780_CARIL|nr:hypothetical protein CIPAW_03G211500 [Carya illinoinensis]